MDARRAEHHDVVSLLHVVTGYEAPHRVVAVAECGFVDAPVEGTVNAVGLAVKLSGFDAVALHQAP